VIVVMAKKFENFYIDHIPRQQNAHADALASLSASLALPAGAQREYLSAVVNYNITNSLLKTVKLQEETFKSKRFLRLR